jgi:PAS domain S-box-containing protein
MGLSGVVPLNVLPVASLTTDDSDHVTGWNRQAEQLFGLEARQFEGLLAGQLPGIDAPPGWRAEGRAAVERQGIWRGEVELLRPDGTRGALDWTIGQGQSGGTLELVHERRQTEREPTPGCVALLETMFALSSMGIALVSLEGKWTRVNRAVERFTGRSEDQLLGEPVGAILHPDDRARADEFRELVLQGKAVHGREPFRVRQLDGGVAYVDAVASTVRQRAEPTAYLVFLVDVTARVKAQRAVVQSEAAFRTIFDESPFSMTLARWDSGEYERVNRAFCEATGRKPEEMIGKTGRLFTPEGSHVKRVLDELEKHGRIDGVETTVTIGPNVRHVLYSAKRIEIDQVPFILAAAHDVTRQKELEWALRESYDKYEQAVSSISSVVWTTDVDESLHFSNAFISVVADRILGLPEGTIGSDWDRFLSYVHPEDAAQVAETIREALREPGTLKSVEYRLVRPDRTVRWVRSVGQIKTGTGPQSHLFGTTEDITERKAAEAERAQLEAQLRQAQKMEAIGTLAGGVAHDFNNVLTAIMGGIDLALLTLPDDSRGRVPLKDAYKASRRAAELTRQLLTFSRRQIIEPQLVQLSSLVENMRSMLARLIGEDVELCTFLSHDPGLVKVDPTQMEQVLVNLAVNSRHAMPSGGKLTIETARVLLDEDYCETHGETKPGDYVMLAVSDTGTGMTPEVRRQVFEPFFTTKPRDQGTGLGLAMVYGAVKQNGGAIEVYSEVGQGTCFKLYLPCVAGTATEARAVVAANEPLPRGTETILFVEDDEAVRNFASKALEQLGYSVFTESNAAAGIHTAEHCGRPIDLLLTDVVLPDMNGRMLAERLRQTHADIRVLYTSGYTQNVIVHHGVLDEGIQFLGKPYSTRSLARRVREVLDGPRATA